MSTIYVKHVRVNPDNHKNAESLIDQAILKETDTKATFRDITSFTDGGFEVYTLVFERL